jgi:hypothetical protein
LKMFNIEHTRNTIVGNPFVRGMSRFLSAITIEHQVTTPKRSGIRGLDSTNSA